MRPYLSLVKVCKRDFLVLDTEHLANIHPPILKLLQTMYNRVGYVTVFFFVFIGEV
jgi:hypothetical protein